MQSYDNDIFMLDRDIFMLVEPDMGIL